MPPITEIFLLILGLAIIVKSADIFVDGASNVAYNLKISAVIVGLTIVAFGTSATEISTSLTMVSNNSTAEVVGNIIGSNIFNIGIVIGVPIAIFGGIGTISFSYIDLIVMVIASILLFMFSFNDYKISKREGILFLILFITYYSYVLVS